MATIEKRCNKSGGITYRITVAGGLDSTGKQIRHRMTWKPEPKMTARQTEKALARAAADFEREIEQGYQIDHKQSFAEYAAYVIDLKERTGIKPRTINNYRKLLPRINQAIGHLKLADIRPQHLNAFYKNLGEQGIRSDGYKATARIDMAAWLRRKHLSRAEIARRAGVSSATVSAAVSGKTISKSKAEPIAAAMGAKLTDIFKLERDTTPLSPSTIVAYHALISSVLSQAEKEMLVPYNAAEKATPPKLQKHDPDYFQPGQIEEILQALEFAPLKWKTLVYVLIDTGCRRGEACGMQWSDIDFSSGTWTIDHQLLYIPKRGIYTGTTKTEKVRTVTLSSLTLTLLKKHRSAQWELQLANGDRWNDTGYVFTQDNGKCIFPDSITDWLNKFSKANGLPHIHPHAFRHTAASIMIAGGVDLVTTANELGHANATTTATIYAHQIAEAKSKATEARHSVLAQFQKEKEPQAKSL